MIMNRLDILKTLGQHIGAKTYLEIGVFEGDVFNHIDIDKKYGVDPDPNSVSNFLMDSDTFFKQNHEKFDLIFIDGLHHSDQVEKDIYNSLKVLNHNGYIVCHDLLPMSYEMQLVPRMREEWTGDCWKTWVKLRSIENTLTMYTIDTDYGCGIIKRGSQECISIDADLTYENFLKNKQSWMNIIDCNTFVNYLQTGQI